MCGRYTLTPPAIDLLPEIFGIDPAELDEPLAGRYNIAPTQQVPVVREEGDGRRHLVLMRWGLVPFWSKDPKKGPPLINARADTVAEKPAFRAAFKSRRCLIPADGFIEWQGVPHGSAPVAGARQAAAPKTTSAKQPIYYQLADHQPFAFAGLWEHWQSPDAEITSCTIITTGPNQLIEPIHDRMPVILPREAYARWLDPREQDPAALVQMLAPYPARAMTATLVSPHVNSVRNDDPTCLAPIA